jgi:uncharacterized membrane protein
MPLSFSSFCSGGSETPREVDLLSSASEPPQFITSQSFIFYLTYITGILVFAVLPGLAKDSLRHAVVCGALFGFFTYATYDLTNLALLKDWSLNVVIVDIVWGVVLCSVVASLSFGVARWIH